MEHTRLQLMKTPGCGEEWECVLCGGLGYELRHVEHMESCLLSDMSVTSVTLVKKRDVVDWKHRDGKWWWVSWTNKEYHVEYITPTVGSPQGRFGLFDAPGGEIASRLTLCSMKSWIKENQGKL